MLRKIGVNSLDELLNQTIPANIRLKEPLALTSPLTEYEFGKHIAELAAKNKLYTTYIMEDAAAEKLLGLLPEELRGAYEPLLREADPEIRRIVKAADKLAAYIKCVEEQKTGNNEFCAAAKQIHQTLLEYPLPEVGFFMEHFLPAFTLTLDELNESN